MPHSQPPDTSSQSSVSQSASHVGGNAMQVAGDYSSHEQTKQFNLNLVVSVFFISMTALGGIAWALNLATSGAGGDANQNPQEQVSEE